MVTWFLSNLSTIIICGVLAAVIAVIILSMVKNKRKGKSSCGCGCQGCAMRDSCRSTK